MRKNQLILISALSPGGRQCYVKPSIKVLEMDSEATILAGSGEPNKLQDYGEGEEYSYIPNHNRVNNKA